MLSNSLFSLFLQDLTKEKLFLGPQSEPTGVLSRGLKAKNSATFTLFMPRAMYPVKGSGSAERPRVPLPL